MSDLQKITESLIAGDGDTLEKLVKEALDAGISADSILSDSLIKGMDIVGDKMESGDMFIPEVLMAAMAMNQSVKILKPLLAVGGSGSVGIAVIGTVKGDLHDIGKNLVKMMMESGGLEVVDLGVDVDPEKFITAVKDNNANVLALSALLTTTMPMMAKTLDALKEAGIRDKVKVIVGGAPVSQEFADQIGADGYSADAGSATKLAKALAAA